MVYLIKNIGSFQIISEWECVGAVGGVGGGRGFGGMVILNALFLTIIPTGTTGVALFVVLLLLHAF